ncbi:MAG TPA: pyrroline-5-carboxylate reductase [Nocardioides sp.]
MTTAIIGAGVMGETLLSGLVRAGRRVDDLLVGEKREDRAAELEERYGVSVVSNADAASKADTVALVVKPQDMGAVLDEIAAQLRPGQLLVSLAAGITTAFIESRVPDGVAVVRVMPNTPALVDEGMAAVSPGTHCDDQHLAEAEALMSSVGRVLRIPERQQDAVTAISGSGPAYIFFVVESMIEAGVHLGLPRATATDLVVQTLVGSATMLRETGTHPTVLREQVTSPGGTTAAALRELEVHRVRAAFLAAREAARDRSRALAEAEELMGSTGRVLRVPERQMDAVTAISGSGPAYIFFVVESMIEAGVHLGLPRATATDLVVQTLVGSAKMLRETGTHPVVLREQVTSPGGTTAAALRELETHKVRAAFLAAMEAARDRSRSLAEGS